MTETSSDIARDLDETRRLLYMALLRQRTDKYELAGTLVNALVHHLSVDADVADVVGHVLGVIENSDTDSVAWMNDQIDQISARLAD